MAASSFDERFYDPAAARPLLDRLVSVSRNLQFSHFATWLHSHYASLCSPPPRQQKAAWKTWRSRCNQATIRHIRSLVDDGVLATKTLDPARLAVPSFVDDFFDSAKSNQLSTSELAAAIYLDYEKGDRQKRDILISTDVLELTTSMHRDGGGEFTTAQICLPSIYQSIALSSDPVKRAAAESWELTAIPNTNQTYLTQYAGDAEVIIASEKVTICVIYVPSYWHEGGVRIKPFLEGLLHRLSGRRYFLFSPQGFKFYRQKHGRFPWDTR